MRCENCIASVEEHHSESYEVDWYCKCGIEDNDRIEDKKGHLGCKLHYKIVKNHCQKFDTDNDEMSTNEYLRSGY